MDNPTKISVNNIILTSMNSSLVIVVPLFESGFYEFNKGDKILRDDKQIVFNQEEYKKTIKYYEKVSFEHLAEDVALRIEKILRSKRKNQLRYFICIRQRKYTTCISNTKSIYEINIK